MGFSLAHHALARLALFGLFALTSCAPPAEDASYSAACHLPTDQKDTLTGRWKSSPIYVSFSTGQFNAYEMGLMMDAADTWNRFYSSAHGFSILDYGTRSAPRQSTRAKPLGSVCQTTLLNSTGGFSGSVVIYKDSVWPTVFSDAAIAITSTCANASTSGVGAMYSAMMELNYENFFSAGKQVPDLASIFVHEFGHLLGLDHSCATTGTPSPKPPLCEASTLDSSYYEAVMYPVVGFKPDGTGRMRRSLNSNDQGRANCLYGENAL